ncbi:MAG: dockerin type I repeat-containing protein [Rhodospirillales bacterium]|nr:dockerin type I repeat-containing protein [Rhodospirillales bacterium]
MGNTPDVGYVVNPTLSGGATLDGVPPAIVSGVANFYAFSGDHGFVADVSNHESTVQGMGTHVIVQATATLNESTGVFPETVTITDLDDNPIGGGGSPVRHDVLFEGVVESSIGDVLLREEIWEFYLPEHTGDFRVSGDVIVHSSFDRLRIDSALTAVQFAATSIPGDYNGDGTVDTADYTVWRDGLSIDAREADGNKDGVVDAADYSIWREAFGNSLPFGAASTNLSGAAAVPEPGTGLLALTGIVVVGMSRRRSCR